MTNRQKEKPSADADGLNRRVAVLDIETDPFKEGRLEINPFCAGFFDGKLTSIFWGADCIEKLVACLKKFEGIVYAHNGGNFDFHFLLEFLPVDDCKFLCMGKRIVQIKTPWGCELRDSYAIIPKKLAAYDKKEIDYAKFEKEVRERHRAEICDYLKSDLQNLRRMVVEFMRRFPCEITLASSVFKMMKKDFDYDPGRSSESYDGKFRHFFFGGRVEFWHLGFAPGKFFIVDINSAYPWAMTKDHWFGFGFKMLVRKRPRKFFEQSLFVIRCKPTNCFPLRAPDGGVYFPTLPGRYYVTGWELKAAEELGLVENLEILICYQPRRIKSMGKFANTLYDRKLKAKQAGDKEEEFFNKIAVNAGYGKLALNAKRFSEVKVTTVYDEPETKKGEAEWKACWHDADRGLSFWKRSSYREGINKFVNVATAASITGCVRAFLMRSIATSGAIYCDTDSLICRDISKLKISDNLGDWKIEMEINSRVNKCGVWIAGKKLYAAYGKKGKELAWKLASKGVKLKPDQIISVANGKMEKMTFEAPTFSFFSKPKFVSREIRRADRRKIK